MKSKWQLSLFIGLILSLVSSAIGCSATPEEVTSTPFSPRNLNIIFSPPGAGVVSANVSWAPSKTIDPLGNWVDYQPPANGVIPPQGTEYERNTRLILTATPAEGFTFAYWGGDRFSYWDSNFPSAVSSPTTWWLIMNHHKTIIAQFTEVSSPIAKVTVSAVTESEADIGWATPPEGYSQIEYGLTENYDSIGNRSEGGKGHSYKLRKLEPETLYHFRILFVSKDGAEFLSNDYVFTTRSVEDLVSAVLYPVRTVSTRDSITHFGSTLFNDSSQTITVYKMQILNESRNIAYAISESGFIRAGSKQVLNEVPKIAEIWGDGEIPSGESLSMSAWVWTPPLVVGREDILDDILEWRVEWYCEAANGERFTVRGEFSSFVDFFNWLTK